MSTTKPIPESEQEKRIKKVLDKIEDLYDDEDYRKYVWAFVVSTDGGQTFEKVDGHLPIGMKLSMVAESGTGIAPTSAKHIIEPTSYKLAAVSASAWDPEHHPISLLRAPTEGAGSPDIYWGAPDDGNVEHSITIDLGETRIIGAIEISPLRTGKYHFDINTSLNPADWVIRFRASLENFGPATVLRLPYLVEDRYVQIVTDCRAITQVKILSMSENSTQEEKEMLSKKFYEQKAKAMRSNRRKT